jgi:hypothetical protein
MEECKKAKERWEEEKKTNGRKNGKREEEK